LKALRELFGPAEGVEGLGGASEGQADHVEVVAFDARDEAAAEALDGVGAGFVVRLAGREIARDVVVRKRNEVDEGGLDEAAALHVRETDESDAGEHGMSAAGKSFEHAASVVGGTGLAKDAAVERDDGVGSNDDGGADGARGDEFGFGFSEALDHVGGRFIR